MDHDAFRTPNKMYTNKSPSLRLLGNHTTSNCKLKSNFTPNSRNRPNTFTIFPIANTTPSRFPKVINPFEAALTDRLHLPLICSPSLFHRPNTPNASSFFEWTIEDVSSLVPANVEPHETQFLTSTDPDTEAKAQAAIDVYFKEHLIVPSPNDSHIRKKVVLPTENEYREKSQKRDGICQTELTLPPKLPKEIEDMLKPYFTYTMNQQQVHSNDCDRLIDNDARDASLRRKLFNTSMNTTCDDNNMELIDLDVGCLSPPPKTPQVLNKYNHRKFSDIPSNHRFSLLSPAACIDDHKNSSFSAISPISKDTTIPSPTTPAGLSKSVRRRRYYSSTSSMYRCTSEKLLNKSIDMEISFKRKSDSSLNDINVETKSHINITTEDISSDEMQISQVSRNSMTPVRHRHNRHRKNLSQSFSYNMGSDEEINDLTNIKVLTGNFIDVKVPLFETDSGFNDCNGSNNNDKNTINLDNNISMCNVDNAKQFLCSTPTKQNNLINNMFII